MDWLSYSLPDFLMFGPEVFLRLFVRVNQDSWPWQGVAVVMAVAVAVSLPRRGLWARRLVMATLAAAWVWSGAGFLLSYYGPVNWPANYFGWGFIGQGLALGTLAVWGPVWRGLIWRAQPGWRFSGIWLLLVALLPWLAVIESGDRAALALFATTPDLTVLATVLILWLVPGPVRWLLLVVPLLWSLFSAATLWALQMYGLFFLPVATLAVTIGGRWLNPSSARKRG